MKFGLFFERFVIIVTSIHQDYYTNDINSEMFQPLIWGGEMITLQGIIITIVILGIFELLKVRRKYNNRNV